MYLPKVYQKFSEEYSEVLETYQKLGKVCRTSGPLEEKYQDLVKLGIAIGANSRGAVLSHTRKALASGASKEEVLHAVLLSLTTTGFPNRLQDCPRSSSMLYFHPGCHPAHPFHQQPI